MLASLTLRSMLASPPLHRELSAMVSRRVPRSDVAPVEAVAVDPSEDRDLLRRVLGEAATGAQSRRVLDWIAREHSGERLVDIAAEERLDPAVVRQRVSRFRKLLRARWLLAAAALGIAVGLARAGSSPIAAYWQDERAATALDTSRSFRVIQVDAPPGVDGAKAELFEAEARLSAITLRGRSLTIVTPVRKLTGRIEMIDEQHGQLRLEDGRSFSIQVRDEGARILVRYGGGTVVLESTTR